MRFPVNKLILDATTIKRFHYDVQAGRCKRFFYGGCEGNYNNFETRQDITGQCKRFLYSGCEGNNNNFKTRRDCVTACRKRGTGISYA
ncbi:uncharacterized protein LOC143050761 [Mytilus galloprovincialis]|uniref:uncharacterized protein LOC143050761 n=1 Tax=Mytilus galloprovincialis TaxID=29158 RepID=UPI003F7C3B08